MANSENSLPICGYPRLAQEMEDASSIAMVRTFTALNNESLLYFQAQLVALEKELRELQRKDAKPEMQMGVKPVPDPRCSTDWRWLGKFSPECEQWKKVLEIRKVLKEYSMYYPDFSHVLIMLIDFRQSNPTTGAIEFP